MRRLSEIFMCYASSFVILQIHMMDAHMLVNLLRVPHFDAVRLQLQNKYIFVNNFKI